MVEHNGSKSGTFGIIRNDDLAILIRCNDLRTGFASRGKEKQDQNDNFIHRQYHSLS